MTQNYFECSFTYVFSYESRLQLSKIPFPYQLEFWVKLNLASKIYFYLFIWVPQTNFDLKKQTLLLIFPEANSLQIQQIFGKKSDLSVNFDSK
jgi:hypothetical protein